MESFDELLEEQLKDLFNAENQLTKALPKLAKKASTDELREAFEMHLDETLEHIERIKTAAKELGFSPSGKICAAMQGLVKEGQEVLEEDGKSPIIDAALVAAAQRVEHYEIAAYGNAKTLANHLGHSRVVKLLDQTLQEEYNADEKLTEVCQEAIFPAGAFGGSDDEAETVARSKNGNGRGRIGGRSGGKSARKPARSSGRTAARA